MFNHHRTGAELGSHTVLIENTEPETDDSGRPDPSRQIVTIPTKYAQPGVLTAEVRSGSNKVDFTLAP